jgi:hypothetical protein
MKSNDKQKEIQPLPPKQTDRYWYDEIDTYHVDAMKYFLGNSLYRQEVPKELIADIPRFIREHTYQACTAIEDRDTRYMPKDAQEGYMRNALTNELVNTLKKQIPIEVVQDRYRRETIYKTKIVIMTPEELQNLLDEVAARSAP